MMSRFLKTTRSLIVLAGLALLPGLSFAVTAPDVMVKEVSDEVLEIVRTDKTIQSGDMTKALQLIDAKILPHFDFTRMTALALGRDWRSATPEQRKNLTAEFRTLLVRSYANALTRFKDYQISFKPLKMQPGDTDVIVRTDVRKAGQQPDSVDYSLYLKDGEWKVFDVAVAGVSLITSYRDAFGQEVKASGIDGLIASLKSKNAQNEGAPAKK
ncbi:MAG: ABC transporter substrate-binding protein [Betaproteobacteria bacterium]|nr:ABC transporter substrate-binding protein [Betaproteobacteria bacterium]